MANYFAIKMKKNSFKIAISSLLIFTLCFLTVFIPNTEAATKYTYVANGEKEFVAICVVGGKNGEITDYAFPCGVCRQALAEFCDADFKIFVGKNEHDIKEFTLGDLLPCSFDKSKLGE